jgi:post-segregation antitoxin (ccd killing protein)
MNKVSGTKATKTGRPDGSADAAPLLMTAIVPAGEDLSARSRQWRQENRAGIDCYNEWIAEHGLPLEEFRRF